MYENKYKSSIGKPSIGTIIFISVGTASTAIQKSSIGRLAIGDLILNQLERGG